MISIKTFISEIIDWIITNPFEPFFYLVVLLFVYFLFAGIGFIASYKETLKGAPRAFMGRALGSIDREVYYEARSKAGGSHMLIGFILLIGSFFIPVFYPFWIKLIVIVGAFLFSFFLAVVWGTKYRMGYHSKKHFDEEKSIKKYHEEQKKDGLRKESIRYLRASFDSDDQFVAAINIYGQEKLMQSIEDVVSNYEFKYSHLKTIAGKLKGRYRYFQDESSLISELLPGGREEYQNILRRMTDRDKKRTEFLLTQIIIDIVDWRLKNKHRAEIKTLLQGNK